MNEVKMNVNEVNRIVGIYLHIRATEHKLGLITEFSQVPIFIRSIEITELFLLLNGT